MVSIITYMEKLGIEARQPLIHDFVDYMAYVHMIYRQVSNIRRTLVGNKIVDHSYVVGASPVGAAPTTSSFSIKQLVSLDWAKTTARRDE